MQNGAYVLWGFKYNTGSELLDMTTPGFNVQDAALAIGTTFNDLDANISITFVGKGGSPPNDYVDVRVVLPTERFETELLT
jgi:hypothetical protein